MSPGVCPVCQRPITPLAAHLACAARPHGPHLPEHIGPYPIVREIGSGGMGNVYAGLQHCPAREVAIKVIKDGVFADDSLRSRFLREREIAGSFEHPNIIRVYDAGEDADGQLYYVMELAHRGTLRDFLHSEPLALRDAIRLMVEVALALDHAHSRDVLHRDLKPDNILIGADRRPRVTDFGVARELTSEDPAAQHHADNTCVGSYPYMAPEQAGHAPAASALDARARGRAADVYGLGAILYELVSGAPPYPVSSRQALLEACASGPPRALHGWAQGMDYDLEAVIFKALAHDPAARYATAAAFAEDLRRNLGGRIPSARPRPWPKRLVSAVSHHARWLGILVAALSISASAVATLEQRAQAHAGRQALQSANALALIFAHAASVTRRFADDPQSAETLLRIARDPRASRDEAWLARIGRDKLISTLFLVTPQGRAVAHFPEEREAYYALDFKSRVYFRGTWLSGPKGIDLGAFVSPLFRSRAQDGQLKLAFSRPVYGAQRALLGVAVVTVAVDTLLDAADPSVSLLAPHELEGAAGPAREERVLVTRSSTRSSELRPAPDPAPTGVAIAETSYQVLAQPKTLWNIAEDGLLLGVLALVFLCALALRLPSSRHSEPH